VRVRVEIICRYIAIVEAVYQSAAVRIKVYDGGDIQSHCSVVAVVGERGGHRYLHNRVIARTTVTTTQRIIHRTRAVRRAMAHTVIMYGGSSPMSSTWCTWISGFCIIYAFRRIG